ncbi:hypothetical protein D3C76_702800 [compost metagenome]
MAALVFGGLDHHHIGVAARRVIFYQKGIVTVVLGVCAQLGGTRLQVSDLQAETDHEGATTQ